MIKRENKEKSFPFSHEEFLKLMVYDFESGVLSWRDRKDTRIRSNAPKGYIKFKIKNVHYGAHRLIWFYHYGKWPEGDVVDHIDRDIHNNRISNLREATFSQNCRNRTMSERIKTENVEQNIFRQGDKFIVKIRKTFTTLEEAKVWQEQLLKL